MRTAGVLLPLFSLPSPYGIGGLGKEARAFVDFLQSAGQSVWQILPIGPTGMGDSPYQTFSVFAGNPYFIALDELAENGLLTEKEIADARLESEGDRVDYGAQYRRRIPLLRLAYERSGGAVDAGEEAWLSDYALFMALKDAYRGAPWWEFPLPLRRRDPAALEDARKRWAEEIGFHCFVQKTFFRQWDAFQSYANAHNVKILGDIPIYTALDSADVWANPQLFQLDEDLRPIGVAGCPPDGFSKGGQLWGNPLYRWEAHREEDYAWWMDRLAHCARLYDRLRIDHFRGFDAYYAIPYGAPDAGNGRWEKGPGMHLWKRVREQLPALSIVAEDLGFITPSVRALLAGCAFPGMRVLQFAFDGRDEGDHSLHLPHLYEEHCVAYTGTHDNQTLVGWLADLPVQERAAVEVYGGAKGKPIQAIADALIQAVLDSRAELAVIPLADYLHCGDEARINTPSTVGDNWVWRVGKGDLTPALAAQIRKQTVRAGRVNTKQAEVEIK